VEYINTALLTPLSDGYNTALSTCEGLKTSMIAFVEDCAQVFRREAIFSRE